MSKIIKNLVHSNNHAIDNQKRLDNFFSIDIIFFKALRMDLAAWVKFIVFILLWKLIYIMIMFLFVFFLKICFKNKKKPGQYLLSLDRPIY